MINKGIDKPAYPGILISAIDYIGLDATEPVFGVSDKE